MDYLTTWESIQKVKLNLKFERPLIWCVQIYTVYRVPQLQIWMQMMCGNPNTQVTLQRSLQGLKCFQIFSNSIWAYPWFISKHSSYLQKHEVFILCLTWLNLFSWKLFCMDFFKKFVSWPDDIVIDLEWLQISLSIYPIDESLRQLIFFKIS